MRKAVIIQQAARSSSVLFSPRHERRGRRGSSAKLGDIALVRLWSRQAKVVGACGGKAGGAAWVVAVTCRALGDNVTVQAKLVDARAAVVEEREALRAGLARRQAVAQARALLKLMQATAHAMSKARAPACQRLGSEGCIRGCLAAAAASAADHCGAKLGCSCLESRWCVACARQQRAWLCCPAGPGPLNPQESLLSGAMCSHRALLQALLLCAVTDDLGVLCRFQAWPTQEPL